MCYLLLLQQDMSLQPFGSSTWNRKFNPFLSFSQVSQFWSFSCTARSRKTNKKTQNNAVILFNCPMIIEILLWPWLKKSKSKSQGVNNCIKPVQFLYTVWGIRLCTCYILLKMSLVIVSSSDRSLIIGVVWGGGGERCRRGHLVHMQYM